MQSAEVAHAIAVAIGGAQRCSRSKCAPGRRPCATSKRVGSARDPTRRRDKKPRALLPSALLPHGVVTPGEIEAATRSEVPRVAHRDMFHAIAPANVKLHCPPSQRFVRNDVDELALVGHSISALRLAEPPSVRKVRGTPWSPQARNSGLAGNRQQLGLG